MTAGEEASLVLEVPAQFLRTIWAWPDASRGPVKAFVSRYLYSGCFMVLIVGGVAFLASGEYDGLMTVLSCVGDTTACLVSVAKIQGLHMHSSELLALQDALQSAFSEVESLLAARESSAINVRCLKRARRISWSFLLLYVPLSVSGIITNLTVAATQDRLTRRVNVNMPAALTESDWTYWPILVITVIVLAWFVFLGGGYDTLFLSLCLHLSSKCEILRVLLRRSGQLIDERHEATLHHPAFEYWNDDGSAFDRDRSRPAGSEHVKGVLRACAQYHQLIIKLRDITERVFANVSLIQMAYLLMGLGIPALRVLYDKSFDLSGGIFFLFYAAWNFSQLLFYCWFADTLAQSSLEVSVAAYAALQPDLPCLEGQGGSQGGSQVGAARRPRHVCNLSAPAGVTLRLLTLRAQRPLHLTAGNFVNLTLRLYLDIIRRSQSMYSYLLRLR